MAQFSVRTIEVFCQPCANDLAGTMELQGIGEVLVEPISTLREWVKCGKCGEHVYAERKSA